MICVYRLFICFFFNDTATTEIYTLSLHDALPICPRTFHDALTVTFRTADALRIERRAVLPSRTPGLHARSEGPRAFQLDRKSTRLNSSHSQISYAVFCLKKKIYRNH